MQRFILWNVHGAGSREKRLKISNKLKDLQADIVLLQEIHLSKTAADVLTTAHFLQVYSAWYNSRQRGVAILISRRVNFTVNNSAIYWMVLWESRAICLWICVNLQKECLKNTNV